MRTDRQPTLSHPAAVRHLSAPSVATRHEGHPSQSRIKGGHAYERQTEKPSPDASEGGFSAVMTKVPLNVAITLGAALVLITVGAAASLQMPDPYAAATPLAYGAVGLSSLIGGFAAGKRCPPSPVLAGFVSSLVVALLLLVVGMCVGASDPLSVWCLRGAVIPLHLLGALLSRKRPGPAAHGDHRVGRHH